VIYPYYVYSCCEIHTCESYVKTTVLSNYFFVKCDVMSFTFPHWRGARAVIGCNENTWWIFWSKHKNMLMSPQDAAIYFILIHFIAAFILFYFTCAARLNFQQNPRNVSHHTIRTSLYYFESLNLFKIRQNRLPLTSGPVFRVTAHKRISVYKTVHEWQKHLGSTDQFIVKKTHFMEIKWQKSLIQRQHTIW